ncbi:probable RNA-binding protein 23 isoform X4 [Narcine bancroftii]|uniref:probable RNA-binding protein 23 isoform X4 n=1 Tax=Narcine bancroftii TaxID=1343680 RepID=UPI0038311160
MQGVINYRTTDPLEWEFALSLDPATPRREIMSSDNFDVVLDAMLEAPFNKQETHFDQKLGDNIYSDRDNQNWSDSSKSRGQGQDRRHRRSQDRRRRGKKTRDRCRRKCHHGKGRRDPRRGCHRSGRVKRPTNHCVAIALPVVTTDNYTLTAAKLRHRHSHSRSPRTTWRRSPHHWSRSISRDRVYGRTLEERDACTVLCLQFSARIRPTDLERFFSTVGRVRDVKIISDRTSRRSKGIAYVEFYEIESVSRAIGLSGEKLLGVPIVIQASQAEKNRPDAGWQPREEPCPHRLYVGSLHAHVTQDMLRAIFQPFGKIHSLQLIKNPDTGISKGYGFVTFAELHCARRALEQLQGFELAGRALKLGPVSDRTVLDTEETEQSGISLGPSTRWQLMARLAAGPGLELPSSTHATLQLHHIYPYGILMPQAAGLTQGHQTQPAPNGIVLPLQARTPG